MRLLNWFLRLFGIRSSEKIALHKRDVVIVVGHTLHSQGAVNYKGEAEFSFNSRIAQLLVTDLRGNDISAQAIYRPADASYKDQVKTIASIVNEMDPQVVLSLHFNSFFKQVYGFECLVTKGAKNEKLALTIGEQIERRLGINPRHDDGIRGVKEGHNGFKMLKAVSGRKRAVCLVEPCFGNSKHHDSMAVFENESEYVLCLLSGIKQYLKLYN